MTDLETTYAKLVLARFEYDGTEERLLALEDAERAFNKALGRDVIAKWEADLADLEGKT